MSSYNVFFSSILFIPNVWYRLETEGSICHPLRPIFLRCRCRGVGNSCINGRARAGYRVPADISGSWIPPDIRPEPNPCANIHIQRVCGAVAIHVTSLWLSFFGHQNRFCQYVETIAHTHGFIYSFSQNDMVWLYGHKYMYRVSQEYTLVLSVLMTQITSTTEHSFCPRSI